MELDGDLQKDDKKGTSPVSVVGGTFLLTGKQEDRIGVSTLTEKLKKRKAY